MENSVAYIIIVFILAAAAAGLACQLAALHSYTTEAKSLDRAQREFAALDPGVPMDTLISRAEVTARSVVGHRLGQVRDIARSPAPPSVAELSAADFERDDSRFVSVLPNTLVSILLIIGLAGTLVSFKAISDSISTMTKEIDPMKKEIDPMKKVDVPELLGSIKKGYSKFGTAFEASLCGIGATVLLLIFRALVHNKRADLFDRLDRFTAAPIYPRFVPQQATDSATLKLAGDQLLETAATFKVNVERMNAFPDAMAGATDTIAGAADEMRAALHGASGAFADFKMAFAEGGDVRANLQRLEGIAGQLGRQANENSEALREAVAVAGKNFGDTSDSVKETGETIAATSAAILAAAENTVQAVQGIAAHSSAMDALTAKLGGIVEKSAGSQHEWAVTISPAIHSLAENAKSLTEAIAPLGEVSKTFANCTRQIGESAKQITAAGEGHTKRFEVTLEKIERMSGETAAAQREFLTGIGAALGAQAAEIGRHLAIAGETQAKRFEVAAHTFERTGGEIAAGQREFFAGLQPILVELPQQVIDLARQQAAQIEKIAGMLAGMKQAQANRGGAAPARAVPSPLAEKMKQAQMNRGERAPEKPRRGFFRRLIFWRR